MAWIILGAIVGSLMAMPLTAETLPDRSVPAVAPAPAPAAPPPLPARAARRVPRRNGFFGVPLLALAVAGAGAGGAAAAAAAGSTASPQ